MAYGVWPIPYMACVYMAYGLWPMPCMACGPCPVWPVALYA